MLQRYCGREREEKRVLMGNVCKEDMNVAELADTPPTRANAYILIYSISSSLL
jgi:hypothetical protein